jgi:hypothetical protein
MESLWNNLPSCYHSYVFKEYSSTKNNEKKNVKKNDKEYKTDKNKK